jgi:hypothetical protein
VNARRDPLFLEAQARPGQLAHRAYRRPAGILPLVLAAALLLLAAGAQAAAANTVTVEGAGEGSGTVTSTGGTTNLDCTIEAGVAEGECEAEVPEFAPLVITATAAEGSEFTGWEFAGAGGSNCSGTKNPCSTIFEGTGEEATLTATFEPIPPHVLKVEGAGTGSAHITSNFKDPELEIQGLDCHIVAGEANEEDVEEGKCEAKMKRSSGFKNIVVEIEPEARSEYLGCSYAGEGLSSCEFPVVFPPEVAFANTVSGEEGTFTVELKALPPIVTGLDPAWGPLEGGNAVTIEGQGLVAVTEVRFGSTPATGLVELSPAELEVTAPPGAPLKEGDSVEVTVTTLGGESEPRKAAGYTYLGSPRALTIASSGAGQGDFECVEVPGVAVTPSGGPYGPCLASYFGGQSVLVRATPGGDSTFGGWSGCDRVLSLTDCLVEKIDSDTTIAAAFHPVPEPPPALPFAPQPFAEAVPAAGAAQGARRARLRRAVAQRKNCLTKARRAHSRARRAANRRRGKARTRVLRAAAKRKARATRRCNSRFQRQRRALRG